ncbi:MAG: ribbon-helix-helix protein, CopG family [Caldilineaceae bacterium]|nr:ribbon-helix-helix protein, CopG family [Caldilineaceae bacterium]
MLTMQNTNLYNASMKRVKTMTIRLSADQAEELNLVAAVDGQPVSQVIRKAIAGHIEKRKQDDTFQDSLRQRIDRAQRMLPRGQ